MNGIPGIFIYRMLNLIKYLFWISFVWALACNDPIDRQSETITDREANRLSKIYALPTEVKAPSENPITSSKVELGRLLFFDPILSGDRDVACATCHHPSNGFAESRDLSIGPNGVGFGSQRRFNLPNEIPLVKRNAHTVLNTAFNGINLKRQYSPEAAPMFWDGRAQGLEEQALLPIKAMEEMRGPNIAESAILGVVVERLKSIAQYVDLFTRAFPQSSEPIDTQNIARAIATYERTLISNQSRFDRFKRGDLDAMSQAEKDGMQLFIDVGCAKCHNGPMFSDYKMHVLGVPENYKLGEIDRGFEDRFEFRTPTLRNLRFTFPFMHNGSLKSIREILEFYQDVSQGKSRNPEVPISDVDPLARSLKLKAKDFGQLENFLLSLNDGEFDKSVPVEVPSGLTVGGNINL